MKIAFQVNDSCTLEFEARDVSEAFQKIAYVQSVFGVKRCGNCESDQVRLKYRKAQGQYEYYSVECSECKHELKFGQQKENKQLFPKGWEEPYSKDNDGEERETRRGRNDEYETAGADGGHAGGNGSSDIPW